MALSNTQEIIDDIRDGKMVILMDDEDRENEGDILIAAEKVTPEIVNFMAKHGRGLICLTLTQERCEQLRLPLMVKKNTEQFSTNFTVSIEAARGIETGISAYDRAMTIQAAVAKEAKPTDIVCPGHIFPVMAKKGGVLIRAGHTEAGCDLAELAGLEPACAIVEILNEDGTMARRPQLEAFAKEHNIKLGTIADLIEYRMANQCLVEKVAETTVNTEFGEFDLITYQDRIGKQLHYALKKGDIVEGQPTLVRVHATDSFKDLLHLADHHWSISEALKKIAAENGVMVITTKQETAESVAQQIELLKKAETPKHKRAIATQETGIGSQILRDLGVTKMRLISSGQSKYHSLSGFGLEIVEYICK
jgi:3,4-dihydroxy 2-butanone 4-phosphate synthase/GTP cyclohydrolase II